MIQAKTVYWIPEQTGYIDSEHLCVDSVRQLQRLESLSLNHWYLCSEIIHTHKKEFELEFQMKDSISEKMEGQYGQWLKQAFWWWYFVTI